MTAEIERRLDGHDRRLDSYSAEIRDVQLWRAEVRGSLRTLQIVVGVAMGIPAFSLGILALSGRVG